MMKKSVCVLLMVAVMSLSASAAIVIEEVEVAQASGATAAYTYDSQTGTGTIDWSAGASGLVLTSTGHFAQFTSVEVSATFTGLNDLSAGGQAEATFDTGTWSMQLGLGMGTGGLQPAVHLGGSLHSLYREEEVVSNDGSTGLEGKAQVTVDTAYFDTGWFGDFWGISDIELQWGDGDGLAGMISSIVFAPGIAVDDYASNYSSNNLTVTLISDETAIPEPATLILIGLGSLVTLRKRKV